MAGGRKEGETWVRLNLRLPREVSDYMKELARRRQTSVSQMVRDYFSGTYKDIPWTSVAAMAFGIVYVVNPFDLVPDFIPFAGYVDDIAVVALVVAAVQLDLKKYCEFRGYDLGDYGF